MALTPEQRQQYLGTIANATNGKRKLWCEALLEYEGRFKWAGANPSSFDSDQADLAMNCWCAPIYIAYKTGRITKKRVDEFQLQAFQHTDKPLLFASQAAAYDFLHGAKALNQEGIAGDILFFFVDSQSGGERLDLTKCPVHVAVNMGDSMCISLWSVPNNRDDYQICRISTLLEEVEKAKRAKCTLTSIPPFWILGTEKTSRCYITTATCNSLGLSDDCAELTTLRWFRDSVLLKTKAGQLDVATYYELAPLVVEAIDKRTEAAEIYKKIYCDDVVPAIAAIEQNDYQKAHEIFKQLVFHAYKSYVN